MGSALRLCTPVMHLERCDKETHSCLARDEPSHSRLLFQYQHCHRFRGETPINQRGVLETSSSKNVSQSTPYRTSTLLTENPRVGSSILPLATNNIIELRASSAN